MLHACIRAMLIAPTIVASDEPTVLVIAFLQNYEA
jgi:hypothetical protein